MTTTQIEFKSHVNPKHAENAITQLGSEESPSEFVQIDLSACTFIDPSAGWRLANGLRRYAEKELLTVILPDQDRFSSEQWFKSFTRTGLGYAIAFHCNRIVTPSGRDITEEIKNYYSRVDGIPAPTHVLVSGIRSKRPFNVDNFSQFSTKFQSMLSKLRAESPPEGSLQALTTFVFEAVQNVYDHSSSAPLPRSTKVFDYLCVNYHANIRNPPDVENRFATYLKRLTGVLPENRRAGFMEVIINDDGVGIAGRQSQRTDIYHETDRQEERAALSEALAQGGSIKLITKDCPVRYDPGHGTQKIMAALRELSAFAFVRTGRLLAYFDGSDASQEAFAVTAEELGYMPGTALEVIIPIVESQLRLAFGAASCPSST